MPPLTRWAVSEWTGTPVAGMWRWTRSVSTRAVPWGSLDNAGAGGMMKARYTGQRVTSKYCPLSLAEMPADFINAYVLGSLGSTGASLGACASFLYNLRHGIDDIRSGRARVAFIGAAEAPVNARGHGGLCRNGRSGHGQGSAQARRHWAEYSAPIRGGPVGLLPIIVASPSPSQRRWWCFSTMRTGYAVGCQCLWRGHRCLCQC